MLAASNGTETWMSILVIALQLAAARELITMGPLRRTLGSVYGAVAAAIQLYNIGPMWKTFSKVGMRGMLEGGSTLMFTMVAVGLVIPVVTVLVVNRADAAVTGKPAAFQYVRTRPGLRVLDETANPGHLMSLRGMLRLLTR